MPCIKKWRYPFPKLCRQLPCATPRPALKPWRVQQPAGPGTISPRRHFSLESIPGILLPPLVFCGLLTTLWTYKCLMMVIFQNKIIYMPSVPPFSRSEKVEDYATQCGPVRWEEHEVKSSDGTIVKLLEGSMRSSNHSLSPVQRQVVVLYLQG